MPSHPNITMVPQAPHASRLYASEGASSFSDISALHCDRRCREVDEAVVARRCAESFKYRRRADSSGDDMFEASSPIVKGVYQSDATRFVRGGDQMKYCELRGRKKCQARLKKAFVV